MPWSSDGGGPKASGPWGGGGRNNGGGQRPGGPWGGGSGGGRGSGGGGQGPNIDDFFKKGQNQLKSVLGGGGGGGGVGFGGLAIAALVGVGFWAYASFHIVEPQERAVVLTFGEFTDIRPPGLIFTPWPVQTALIEPVTQERSLIVGADRVTGGRDNGVMLTGDEKLIDVNFQVVWTVSRLDNFLFNLADPNSTISAVAESAMREVVGRSDLAPLLNRDRELLADQVQDLIQRTLDNYEAGVQITRVNLDGADPPAEVLKDYEDVQAAERENDRLQDEADRIYNEVTAAARGEAAQIRQAAEGYRARVVAEAEGEAARFTSVFEEYKLAPEVTRRRLYIETMERVFGGMEKIIIDESAEGGGDGTVKYLPLDPLRRANAGN